MVDEHAGLLTLAGVTSSVAINPHTTTNDRYDIFVELEEPPLDDSTTFELRIERLGRHPARVHTDRCAFMPEYSRSQRWMEWVLPSLPPQAWDAASLYRLELWHEDQLLAYRGFSVVPIRDYWTPPSEGSDE